MGLVENYKDVQTTQVPGHECQRYQSLPGNLYSQPREAIAPTPEFENGEEQSLSTGRDHGDLIKPTFGEVSFHSFVHNYPLLYAKVIGRRHGQAKCWLARERETMAPKLLFRRGGQMGKEHAKVDR